MTLRALTCSVHALLPIALGVCASALPASVLAETPAELKIVEARAALDTQPEAASAHTALALALARRARETSRVAYYDQALAALDQALLLSPGDFEAERTRGWVLLGKHEFAAALELARSLNRRFPDDLMTYALLVDANVELGHYADAEESAQRLLDLRPGSIPGLTRAAYLRELFGDVEGALELMLQALARVPPAEVEDQAWLLAQLAHLHLSAGRVDVAAQAVDAALQRFPDYHYALGQLARVHAARGEWQEALAAERRHYSAAPHPENLYLLARATARSGRAGEAGVLFAEFERQAQAESAKWDNANRELIQYYAEEGAKPAAALTLAEQEIARRQDLHTLAAQAWALYRTGKEREAATVSEQALAVGSRDPDLLYQAAQIQAAAGASARALDLLQVALAVAPWHEWAAQAQALQAELTALRAQSAGASDET